MQKRASDTSHEEMMETVVIDGATSAGSMVMMTLMDLLMLNAIVCGLEFCASAAFCYIPPLLLKAGIRWTRLQCCIYANSSMQYRLHIMIQFYVLQSLDLDSRFLNSTLMTINVLLSNAFILFIASTWNIWLGFYNGFCEFLICFKNENHIFK